MHACARAHTHTHMYTYINSLLTCFKLWNFHAPSVSFFLCVDYYYSTSTAATKTSPHRTAIDRTLSSNIGSLPVERVAGGKPHTHTHTHTHTHIHPTNVRVLACVHTVATTLTQRSAHTLTQHTHTRVLTCMCVHTHTHTHTYTHSHTHTLTQRCMHTHTMKKVDNHCLVKWTSAFAYPRHRTAFLNHFAWFNYCHCAR